MISNYYQQEGNVIMIKELENNELETVTGGRSTEKKVTITLNLEYTREDKEIKVYVDGVYDSSKYIKVDGSEQTRTFTFTGSRGTKEVKIKINNDIVYYVVDFDSGISYQK